MTVFNKTTDLPASVDTVEKLAAWTLLLLYKLHKTDEVLEADEVGLVPLITLQQGLAANETERLIFRISLQLNQDWATNAAKLWTQSVAFAAATIPDTFKV